MLLPRPHFSGKRGQTSSVQAPETPYYARTLSYTTLPYYRWRSFLSILLTIRIRYHVQLRITLFVFSGLVSHLWAPLLPSPTSPHSRAPRISPTITYIMFSRKRFV